MQEGFHWSFETMKPYGWSFGIPFSPCLFVSSSTPHPPRHTQFFTLSPPTDTLFCFHFFLLTMELHHKSAIYNFEFILTRFLAFDNDSF